MRLEQALRLLETRELRGQRGVRELLGVCRLHLLQRLRNHQQGRAQLVARRLAGGVFARLCGRRGLGRRRAHRGDPRLGRRRVRLEGRRHGERRAEHVLRLGKELGAAALQERLFRSRDQVEVRLAQGRHELGQGAARTAGAVRKRGKLVPRRGARQRRGAHERRHGRCELLERAGHAGELLAPRGGGGDACLGQEVQVAGAREARDPLRLAPERGAAAHLLGEARTEAEREARAALRLAERTLQVRHRHVALRRGDGATHAGQLRHERHVVLVHGVEAERGVRGAERRRRHGVDRRRVVVLRKALCRRKRREAEAAQLLEHVGERAALLAREALDRLGVRLVGHGRRRFRELLGALQDVGRQLVDEPRHVRGAERGRQPLGAHAREPRERLAGVGEVCRGGPGGRVGGGHGVAGCAGDAECAEERRRMRAGLDGRPLHLAHRHARALVAADRQHGVGRLPEHVAELAQRAVQVRVRLLRAGPQRVHVHVAPGGELHKLAHLALEERALRADARLDLGGELCVERRDVGEQRGGVRSERRPEARKRTEQGEARGKLADAATAQEGVQRGEQLGALRLAAGPGERLVEREEPRGGARGLVARLLLEQVRPAVQLEPAPLEHERGELARVRAQRRLAACKRLPVVEVRQQLLQRGEHPGHGAVHLEAHRPGGALRELLQLHLLGDRLYQLREPRVEPGEDRRRSAHLLRLRVVVKVGVGRRGRAPLEQGQLHRRRVGVAGRRQRLAGERGECLEEGSASREEEGGWVGHGRGQRRGLRRQLGIGSGRLAVHGTVQGPHEAHRLVVEHLAGAWPALLGALALEHPLVAREHGLQLLLERRLALVDTAERVHARLFLLGGLLELAPACPEHVQLLVDRLHLGGAPGLGHPGRVQAAG